eukprot:4297009-Karenia_brevis.AAC.1
MPGSWWRCKWCGTYNPRQCQWCSTCCGTWVSVNGSESVKKWVPHWTREWPEPQANARTERPPAKPLVRSAPAASANPGNVDGPSGETSATMRSLNTLVNSLKGSKDEVAQSLVRDAQ